MPASTPKRNRSRLTAALWSILLPFSLYLLVVVVITWPAVTQLATFGIGAGYGDQFENARLVWWTQYALQHGLNPFYQSLLGYPDGFFSAAQWAQPLGYLPAVAISFITGPVAAVNVWLLIELALDGLTMFVLCRAILAAHHPENKHGLMAAWIGGLIFMLGPTLQGHLNAGHINVLALYGLPIYALCLWQITSGTARWRKVLIGAVMILIVATGDTDQAVYTLLPLTLFWLGYGALCHRQDFWQRAVIARLGVMFGLGFCALFPFFLPLVQQLSGANQHADLTQGGWVAYSTDPLSFIALSPFTPWGKLIAPTYTRTVLGTNSIEGTAYLGLVAAVLCIIALLVAIRRRWLMTLWPWLTVALGSAIFSLGPFLKWADQPIRYTLGNYQSYLTLPWALFQMLPGLNASRTPGRFNLTTVLAVAVVAALGADWLLNRVTRRSLKVVIAAILLVGIGFDDQLFAPVLTTEASVPAYMNTLATRSEVRAVFDIPWDDNLAAKDALYWQTIHHKPMIAGQTLRTTPVDPAKLNILQAAVTGSGTNDQALALLDLAGIDVLIVHLAALPDRSMLGTINQRLGVAIFQDDRIAVYNVPKTTYRLTASELFTWRGSDRQTLLLYAPAAGYLHFSAGSAQSGLLRVDGQIGGQYSGDLYLARGYHSLQAQNGTPFSDLQPIFDPIQPITSIRWGSMLNLLATMIRRNGDQLIVSSTWRTDQAVAEDDHFFVHLIAESGRSPVVQHDGQPGSGAFPTTGWPAEQTWTETNHLDLTGLAPGTYQIQIGWYRYPGLQPLLVEGQGAFDLGTITISTLSDYF